MQGAVIVMVDIVVMVLTAVTTTLEATVGVLVTATVDPLLLNVVVVKEAVVELDDTGVLVTMTTDPLLLVVVVVNKAATELDDTGAAVVLFDEASVADELMVGDAMGTLASSICTPP